MGLLGEVDAVVKQLGSILSQLVGVVTSLTALGLIRKPRTQPEPDDDEEVRSQKRPVKRRQVKRRPRGINLALRLIACVLFTVGFALIWRGCAQFLDENL